MGDHQIIKSLRLKVLNPQKPNNKERYRLLLTHQQVHLALQTLHYIPPKAFHHDLLI